MIYLRFKTKGIIMIKKSSMVEKNSFFLVLLAFLLIQNNIFAQQKIIIYGDDNYPPYSYNENGLSKGIYVYDTTLIFASS